MRSIMQSDHITDYALTSADDQIVFCGRGRGLASAMSVAAWRSMALNVRYALRGTQYRRPLEPGPWLWGTVDLAPGLQRNQWGAVSALISIRPETEIVTPVRRLDKAVALGGGLIMVIAQLSLPSN